MVGRTCNAQRINMQSQRAYEPRVVWARWQVPQPPFSRHFSSSTWPFRLPGKNWKHLFYFHVINFLLFNTRCDGVPCGLQHLLRTYAHGRADTRDGHEDARKRLYRRLYSLLWVCATSTVVGRETIFYFFWKHVSITSSLAPIKAWGRWGIATLPMSSLLA